MYLHDNVVALVGEHRHGMGTAFVAGLCRARVHGHMHVHLRAGLTCVVSDSCTAKECSTLTMSARLPCTVWAANLRGIEKT